MINPLIVIPARMASTRLPDKPLADIHGLPMIAHVVKRALESGLGRVIVAADGEAILDAVEAAGGEAIITDPNHPSGSDRVWEAVQKADPDGQYDVIVNLQGDLPTLAPALVKQVLAPLQNPDVDIATLACEIHDAQEKEDPAVVKPVISFAQSKDGQIGQALYFTRTTTPSGDGPLYHHIGIYAYRRASLEKFVSLPPSPLEQREKLEQLRALENGLRIDVALVDTVPLGVDTPEHLEKAREMLK